MHEWDVFRESHLAESEDIIQAHRVISAPGGAKGEFRIGGGAEGQCCRKRSETGGIAGMIAPRA